ncbi:hypothetical protein RQP46_006345 [Phenoliferia psychrophenolica]
MPAIKSLGLVAYSVLLASSAAATPHDRTQEHGIISASAYTAVIPAALPSMLSGALGSLKIPASLLPAIPTGLGLNIASDINMLLPGGIPTTLPTVLTGAVPTALIANLLPEIMSILPPAIATVIPGALNKFLPTGLPASFSVAIPTAIPSINSDFIRSEVDALFPDGLPSDLAGLGFENTAAAVPTGAKGSPAAAAATRAPVALSGSGRVNGAGLSGSVNVAA